MAKHTHKWVRMKGEGWNPLDDLWCETCGRTPRECRISLTTLVSKGLKAKAAQR